MKSVLFLTPLFFLVLVPIVLAVGTCTLDQETYYKGETGTLRCICTSPSEHNVAGRIIFKNDNGTVLQNTSTNSAICTSNFFGASYTFNTPYINGTSYFETSDSSWNGAGDNKTDNFKVLNTSSNVCIIQSISSIGTYNLGEIGAAKIEIVDSVTGNPLINVRCRSEAYNTNEAPLLSEPYESYILTTAGGEAVFMHRLNEDLWLTNTSYIYEFHCNCPPNSSVSIPEERCIDEGLGQPTGFRACSVQAIFTTGTDQRDLSSGRNTSLLWVVILLPFLLSIAVLSASFLLGEMHAVMKLFMILMPFLGFFVSMNMAAQTIVSYYGFEEMQDLIGSTTYWVALTFFVMISYFLVFFLVAMFKSIQDSKKARIEI